VKPFDRLRWGGGLRIPKSLQRLNSSFLDRLGPQNRLAGAQVLFARLQRKYGEDNPMTVRVMIKLANELTGFGRYDEAIELERRALAVCIMRAGEDSDDTVRCRGALVRTFFRAKEYDQAKPVISSLVDWSLRVNGPDHPVTRENQTWLAEAMWRTGESDEAEALLQEILDSLHHSVGDPDTRTLNARRDLGRLYADRREYDIAIPLQRELVEFIGTLRGRQDDKTQSELVRLGSYLFADDQMAEARIILTNFLSTQDELGVSDSEDVRAARTMLSRIEGRDA
jgi:tetratricopeptide (TPR) repeat protein